MSDDGAMVGDGAARARRPMSERSMADALARVAVDATATGPDEALLGEVRRGTLAAVRRVEHAARAGDPDPVAMAAARLERSLAAALDHAGLSAAPLAGAMPVIRAVLDDLAAAVRAGTGAPPRCVARLPSGAPCRRAPHPGRTLCAAHAAEDRPELPLAVDRHRDGQVVPLTRARPPYGRGREPGTPSR